MVSQKELLKRVQAHPKTATSCVVHDDNTARISLTGYSYVQSNVLKIAGRRPAVMSTHRESTVTQPKHGELRVNDCRFTVSH